MDINITYTLAGSTFWKSVFVYLSTDVIRNGMSAPHILSKKSVRSLNTWDKAKVSSKAFID